jgi:hypothetical protein
MAIFRNGIIAPFLMQANFGKLFFTESQIAPLLAEPGRHLAGDPRRTVAHRMQAAVRAKTGATPAHRSHCRPLSSTPPAKCPPNTGITLPSAWAMQSLASFQTSALPLRLSSASFATSTTGTIEPSISLMNVRPFAGSARISRAISCAKMHCAWCSVISRIVPTGMSMP